MQSKHFQKLCGLLVCFCLGRLPVTAAPVAPAAVFVLDSGRQHQVMDNFGANDAWFLQNLGSWSETNKQRIAELLFSTEKGIGLSCWRFYVGAGLNRATIHDRWRTLETFEVAPGEYDWTRQAGGRWFLQAAKAHGVRQFLATFYSPPPRLTRNGLSNLGSDQTSTSNLKPGAEAAYAGYITDILKHFRDNPDARERIEFDYVLPVNEPQWAWQRGQEGNRVDNDGLKRIFSALTPRLRAAGLKTRILGPESGSLPGMYSVEAGAREQWHADYGDYLRLICGDPDLAAGFGGVLSYHSYWSDRVPDQLVPHRERLAAACTNYPAWKLWQSEYCVMEPKRDLTMVTALRVAQVIHCDLTIANASAWQWWLALAGEDYKSGLIYTDYRRSGDPETIYESKTLWALGNYSRFIRPGMKRVELREETPGDINGVMGSAYWSPQDGRVVLVFINMKPQVQRVRVANAGDAQYLPLARRFVPYTTSAQSNLEPGKPQDISTAWELPAQSIVTLVLSFSLTPPTGSAVPTP